MAGVAAFALPGLGCSALLPLTIWFGPEQLESIAAAAAGGIIAFYQVGTESRRPGLSRCSPTACASRRFAAWLPVRGGYEACCRSQLSSAPPGSVRSEPDRAPSPRGTGPTWHPNHLYRWNPSLLMRGTQ